MEKIDKTKLSKEILEKSTIKNNAFVQVAKDNPKDKIDVEIGDTKDTSKFHPQQKIMRWDNEVNCSVRLIHDEKKPKVTTEKDKIVWEGDKIKAEIYQLTEGEGGQEFEITLKEKPKSNVVKFTVVDKGVNYFYQPFLANQNEDGSFWEEEEGGGRSECPANVGGSYAIYASENKINYVGGKEYKCGKVGHIYRPKIIDSTGTEVWGDLHIENGILSVTIPQEFLDKAVYPVRHAAGLTLGYTSIGSNSTNSAANEVRLTVATTSDASGGTLSKIQIAISDETANHHVKMALYDGTPTNLIANSSTGAVEITQKTKPTQDSEWTSSTNVSATISGSTAYCVAYDLENSSTILYTDGTFGAFGKYLNYSSFPTSTVSGLGNKKNPSIYATYTVAPSEVTPTVTTQAVTSILQTTATGNGNVTADGGATITERGVCWNTSTNPTTSNSKATSAGTTGVYTVSMTGLSANTLYYVKAYAINSVGTSYGSEVTFTTLDYPKTTGISSITGINTITF